jgi:corticosteroid 11-beta-dehydrogenase isozyme 1
MSKLLFFAALPLIILVAQTLTSQVFDGFDANSVRGQRVFVGGASTGIGEQIAYRYSQLGAHVALLSRREDVLQKVATRCRELGAASAVVVTADVSTPDAAAAALKTAIDSESFAGKLDVLVLNHVLGMWSWWLPDPIVAPPGETLLTEPEAKSGGFDYMRKMFEVNVFSYIYLATMAMPVLEKSGGRVVVVGSGAGLMGLPKVAPYSASKHAINGFFESLRLELLHKRSPVSVTVAHLGNIDTENNRENTAGSMRSYTSSHTRSRTRSLAHALSHALTSFLAHPLTCSPLPPVHPPLSLSVSPTQGDLQYVKHSPANTTAHAIVRAAATRQREIFHPIEQGELTAPSVVGVVSSTEGE